MKYNLFTRRGMIRYIRHGGCWFWDLLAALVVLLFAITIIAAIIKALV